MKKILFLAALSSLLLAKTVTFDEVLKETLNNNLELKAKKLNIDKAKATLNKVKGMEWGKFIFNEEISRTNNPLYVFGMKLGAREATFKDFGFSDFLANMGGLMSGSVSGDKILSIKPHDLNYPAPRSNFATKFIYEIPIFTGFKLTYAKEMAKLQILANKFKYQRDKTLLALEVLKAYNGAVAAKYFINALEKAKETTTSFVKMVKEFKKEGMATEIDLLQAKKRDSEVDAYLEEAKNKYTLALAYLRFLSDDYDISDVNDFAVVISPDSNLNNLIKSALKNRNDLKWMKKNYETMKKKVKFDKAENYPMIGAHLEYGWNDNTIANIRGDKNYWLAAVGVKYNIFDKSRDADIEKSKIEALQTNYYYQYMKKGIALDVKQKYLNLKTKSKIIKNKLINKELAEEILNKYTYMYKQGMINMTILLMKEADARKARAELIKAKYDEAVAAAKLKASIGNLINNGK